MTESLAVAVAVALLLWVYCLPWFIAKWRNARSTGVIAVLNIVLGCSGFVWIILLIWAAVSVSEETAV